MRLRYKLWLHYRGRAFGDGPARLLDGVDRAGSLRKAAVELHMSYNKAWRSLRAAEERLGFPLLDRSVGGSLGGGSQLTPQAKDLVRRYRALSDDVDQALEEIFQRHFHDWEMPQSEEAEDPEGAEDGEDAEEAGEGADTPPSAKTSQSSKGKR